MVEGEPRGPVKSVFDALHKDDTIKVVEIFAAAGNACARERLMEEVLQEQDRLIQNQGGWLWDQHGRDYKLSLVPPEVADDTNGSHQDVLRKIFHDGSNSEYLLTVDVDQLCGK